MRSKSEDKRKEILKAATDVFIEKGYGGASISEIAMRVGGSKSTLYNYFSSKEALFFAVMEEMARLTARPLIDDLEQACDPKVALENFVYHVMKLLCTTEMMEFRRMLISEGRRTNIGKKMHELEGKKYLDKFAKFYDLKMREGYFIKADPLEAAMHMYSLCYGPPVQLVLAGVIETASEDLLKQASRSVANFFFRGYSVTNRASTK